MSVGPALEALREQPRHQVLVGPRLHVRRSVVRIRVLGIPNVGAGRFQCGDEVTGFADRDRGVGIPMKDPDGRSSNDAGDEGSIVIASTAGLDAFKQRPALLATQEEAEKAFEKFQPLQHRGTHRRSELSYRCSGACLI